MQRQLDLLAESLREFIAQPNYPTLVLAGTDAASVFPQRILAAFDRQDEHAYYLLFPQPCADAAAYFEEVLKSVRIQLEIFDRELQARSLPPLAPLPLEAQDARHPAARRLVALARHLGEQMPSSDPLVWALLPGELSDATGYRQLVEPLLLPDGVPPWMDRHRFLVRDRREAPLFTPELRAAKNDRLLVLELDLDTANATSSLAETAADPTLPADERILAFFQLGGVDMALGRYAEALEKYGVAFNHYQSTSNRPMQALCLSSAGDTLRQSGDSKLGLERYQQSLVLSVEERSAPLIRPAAHGAGLCCLDLGQNVEAEGYLQHSNQLAGKLYDPFAKSDALEQLGVARYRQRKVTDAVETWLVGKDLALKFGYEHRAAAILDRLAEACDEQGLTERADSFRRERAPLDAPSGGHA